MLSLFSYWICEWVFIFFVSKKIFDDISLFLVLFSNHFCLIELMNSVFACFFCAAFNYDLAIWFGFQSVSVFWKKLFIPWNSSFRPFFILMLRISPIFFFCQTFISILNFSQLFWIDGFIVSRKNSSETGLKSHVLFVWGGTSWILWIPSTFRVILECFAARVEISDVIRLPVSKKLWFWFHVYVINENCWNWILTFFLSDERVNEFYSEDVLMEDVFMKTSEEDRILFFCTSCQKVLRDSTSSEEKSVLFHFEFQFVEKWEGIPFVFSQFQNRESENLAVKIFWMKIFLKRISSAFLNFYLKSFVCVHCKWFFLVSFYLSEIKRVFWGFQNFWKVYVFFILFLES